MMQRSKRRTRPLACIGLLLGVITTVNAAHAQRHVASPDWRDQIVYFAMIDRFDDADLSNNDQGMREYDPASGAHYSGGDLAGLTRRLDYLRELGATALWITPPVRHQWWDGAVNYGGYHGYWGEHFAEVDPHFGTLDDFRALADGLHARGMFLIQDIVVNHTGNYFSYPQQHDPRQASQGYACNPSPGANAAPTQSPFDLNDARDAAQRAADIYHWTPVISDFTDPRQEQTFQLAALDDLNTENPTVRRALRASYAHWIREVGVDAFRVDTAFYVAPAYFRDFLHSSDPVAPGVLQVAAQTGRSAFHVFGEGFGIDPPFEEAQARKIERWARDEDGDLLPGMINFPLYGSLLDVFARGQPAAVLGHRIASMMRVHARPHLMPSFVDNHDVDRFLAGGDAAGLDLALLAIHTLPGIPVIYYGTEQGFTEPRAAMFAGGYRSGGIDRFDQEAPIYRRLQALATMRRTHRVFSRGTPHVVHADAAGPGALVYAMRHGDDVAVIALNSASHPILLAAASVGLPAGSLLQPLHSIDGEASQQRLDAQGRLTMLLPARSGQVWRTSGVEAIEPALPSPRIDALPDATVVGALELSGHSARLDDVHLVLDGDVARATPVRTDTEGRWRLRIDTSDFVDAAVEHRVVAWSPAGNRVSAPRQFRVEPRWQPRLEYEDPIGDDHGPDGRYVYPTDPLWREHRPADVRAVRVSTSGTSLKIDVRLADVIAAWNPPNGFDHVALTLFVELPDRDGGARAMPGQYAELPDRMRWHYRLRVGGWSNALFSAEGADAQREGSPLPIGAMLGADRNGDTITMTLPSAALGRPATLDGARIYLSTWDYDGGFRSLAPDSAAFGFGGGDADAPRVMDDTAVLRIRTE